MSSVSPGHPLIGQSKGGQGGNVFRVRTMLCSRQGIEVVVAVEEGDRRPSFGRWTRQKIKSSLKEVKKKKKKKKSFFKLNLFLSSWLTLLWVIGLSCSTLMALAWGTRVVLVVRVC